MHSRNTKNQIRNQIIYGHPLSRRVMYIFQISNHLSFIYQNVEISFHYPVAKILLREARNCVTMDGVNSNVAEISRSCLFNYPNDKMYRKYRAAPTNCYKIEKAAIKFVIRKERDGHIF